MQCRTTNKDKTFLDLLIIFDRQTSIRMKYSLPGVQNSEVQESTQAKRLPPNSKTKSLEDHLMGLVTIPEREPGAKIGFQLWDSLNSLDQSSIHSLLVILLEVRQRLGCLQIQMIFSTVSTMWSMNEKERIMLLKHLPPSLSQKARPRSSSPSASSPWQSTCHQTLRHQHQRCQPWWM